MNNSPAEASLFSRLEPLYAATYLELKRLGLPKEVSSVERLRAPLKPPMPVWQPRRRSVLGLSERLEEPGAASHLDPVVERVVQNGGLRTDLISDIVPGLRPVARSIPGFLRRDGHTWLTLARLHYINDEVVEVEERPHNDWQTDTLYETVSGYQKLVNYALDYSYPNIHDEQS